MEYKVGADASRVAAIDVGSNSVRLLHQGKKIVEITRLSDGLMHTGRLMPEAIKRTADEVFRQKNIAVAAGAEQVFVFATEAVRAAENGGDFLQALALGGVTLDVISSKKESELGFLGAYTSGICAIADIGGASSELAVGNENGIFYSHSVPIGAVRLYDYSKLQEEQIVYSRNRMKEYGYVPPFEKLVILGGTASTFVAINEKLEPYDPRVVHGYYLTLKQVERITDMLAGMTEEERLHVPGLPAKKARVAVPSGVLLAELVRYLGRDGFYTSERDNLEGYLTEKGFSV